MEYSLIELFLVGWMLLAITLNRRLINQYPKGLSRKQAEIDNVRAFFYLAMSLSLCCLIYFSTWLASWSNTFAVSLHSTPTYAISQLADVISIINLSINASVITFIFTAQKRNLFIYQRLFGLPDVLPLCSLEVMSQLALSKQVVLAERLSWVIEKVEKDEPFQLSILFEKDDLNILAKIFAQTDSNNLDYRLAPIYQEVNRLTSNPKPFSIIL